MCGFVSVLDCRGEIDRSAVIDEMLRPITHRGPDDSGVLIEGPVAFGFRRLSILDLTAQGHQPMTTIDEKLTIVFNGEIFNFLELRSELESLGHQFRSKGDTEVLLAAYRQWGSGCLGRLNGMWAFVIYDRSRNILFGARDRFGIKPLYRWRNANGSVTCFASEIKSIRKSGLYRAGLDLKTVAAFLYEGSLDTSDRTFHDGIVQMPAGHAFELTLDGKYKEWPWWDLEKRTTAIVENPAREFAELFEDAIRIHMRSDVPIGVNLSGGLDSTAIICAAARVRAESGSDYPLMAFCYQDSKFDESRYIADTLALTGAQLVPLEMTPQQIWESLPSVLEYQDEPVHSMTAVVGYQLMALAARSGVKVILNGQGADEVIGGYGSYFKEYWSDLIAGGYVKQAWNEISAYTTLHGGSALKRFQDVILHVVRNHVGRLEPYRMASEWKKRSRLRSEKWINPELADHVHIEQIPPINLRSVLEDSVKAAPLPLYLRVEDRNSMAHSVEVRLPFLDYRLVNLVFSMESRQKICGPWNKNVLREAMYGRIPESVRTRVDKMGFPTNTAVWFRDDIYESIRKIIYDESFGSESIFNANELRKNLELHRSGGQINDQQLFRAISFFVWKKQILEC